MNKKLILILCILFFSPILLKADELINKFDEKTVPILNDEMRKVRNDLEDKIEIPNPVNGDIVYYNSGWSSLAKGTNGQYLQQGASIPQWTTTPYADFTHRQDNTTNNTISGVVVEHGWGFIQGDATTAITEAVTFSSAYSNIPVVLVSYCGKTAVLPDSLDDFGTPYQGITTAMPHTITTTGFTVYMSAENGVTSFPNTDYFGYTWIAIGTK